MRARSPAPESVTVQAAAAYVLLHPWHVFVVDWNWKTAALSAIFRVALWPLAMGGRERLLSPGSLRGVWIEFVFRIAVGGFWGSLLQVFSGARPEWLAGIGLVFLLPGCVHLLEYLALRTGGAAHASEATLTSIAFSVASLFVNWCLMRKGVLLTGHGTASLVADLRRIFGIMTGLPPEAEADGENPGGPA
jgi:hypothetical protein